MKKIENDDGMKQKLMNHKLRSIIESIDDSKRPQKKLEAMMANNQEFAKFINYMLNVIGFRSNVKQNRNNKSKEDEDDDLSKFYEDYVNLDAMNDNDKFKYLLREMLNKYND